VLDKGLAGGVGGGGSDVRWLGSANRGSENVHFLKGEDG